MSDDNAGLSLFDEDDSAPEEPRRAHPRRRRRRWLPVLVVLVALLLIPVAVIGVYAWNIERAFNSNLNRDDTLIPPESDGSLPPRPEKPDTAADTLNVVLMGTDERADEGGRSDALMLVHLNAAHDKAYIISFPRDMWVDVPGHGENKINAAFAYGGAALTIATVEQLTGVRADHAATIGMQDFVRLTETLGGVTVYNKHYSKSEGYEFPVGEITISGDEALAYVRERKQLPRGDLDRAERQRAVVQAIIAKGLSPETITQPGKFMGFVESLARYITVDSNLTESQVRDLALSMRMSPSDLVIMQAPDKGTGTSADGQSIVNVDAERMAELSEALRNDDMAGYVEKYGAR